MTQQYPDRISARGEVERVVYPDIFKVLLRIEGKSAFFGGEALKKSKELVALVQSLQEVGLAKESVRLEGVHLETASGLLSKESRARYDVIIAFTEKSLMPGVLGTISAAKNAQIMDIVIDYSNLTSLKNEMLVAAAKNAQQQAEMIAAAINLKIVGLYSLNQDWTGPSYSAYSEQSYARGIDGAARMSRRARPQPTELEAVEVLADLQSIIKVTVKCEFKNQVLN